MDNLAQFLFLQKYQQKNLRKCQLKQLDILIVIDAICRKHQIQYWLDGGTLLGAVRHKGFIPWDDDIDIAVKQEDILRFTAAMQSDLPDQYFLQTVETDPSCRLPIIKVRDSNSILVEAGDDFSKDYHKGIYVDIFPMHPYPTISRKWCRRIAKGYCRSNAILSAQHRYSLRSIAELFYFGIKRFLCKSLWNVVNIIYGNETYYGNRLSDNGYGIYHRQDSIFPVRPIEFEGVTFFGPSNPDAYLSDLYGDYMQLPPENKRKVHAVFFMSNLE